MIAALKQMSTPVLHQTRMARTIAACLASAALLSACASSKVAPAQSPTGGIALDVLVRKEGGANELFVVDRDGTFKWAGGFDAVNGRPTWTGQITRQEADDLLAAMRSNGWLDGRLRVDAPAKWPVYEIKVRAPGDSYSSEIRGESAQVPPVLAVLDRIAQHRNDAYLDMFPKAGLQNR
jgi:hypothetical protein